MSGHLCLKWNNHSSAFLKSISNIQVKERYCDATIVCQGKYFPVHRIILSTCSDYFDEIFERIQCQHPYIVFKDIEPREMELLLNYMYQGEVNVVQEMLPTLIKAAEALRVKGLAVPDDLPSSKDSSAKKRSNQSNDNPQPKRRSEDSSKKRRGDSSDLNTHSENAVQTSETQNYQGCDSEGNLSERVSFHSEHQQTDNQQSKIIKEEPLDPGEYDSGTLPTDCTVPSESQPINKEENIFVNFPVPDDSSSYIKTEDNLPNEQPFEHEQTSTWTDFASTDVVQSIPPAEMGIQSDMIAMNQESDESSLRKRNGTSLRARKEGPSLVHGENQPQNISPWKYWCPNCPYGSVYRKDVKRHMLRHTGEKPFHCTICSSRFGLKTNLHRHMLIHTGEKPFECPFCVMKFSQKANLKNHLSKKSRCYKP